MHKATNFLFSLPSMAFIVAGVLPGCTSYKTTTMMPAPVVYQNFNGRPLCASDGDAKKYNDRGILRNKQDS